MDGRRKSMQPMAGRLGVDHRQLQQFMTSSTWPVNTVRAGVARRAVAVVRSHVWVVDDTGFPKDGTSSPGVANASTSNARPGCCAPSSGVGEPLDGELAPQGG
ncbi:transposase [Streptomyces sp. NBC_01023]|uniref:transposase n=1 Tax=Streptomyces sp. NBC_01023 TaxID=2903724 RepID=UPI00386989A7|nr:transposase [Streptomyces sp. NBC_01023]